MCQTYDVCFVLEVKEALALKYCQDRKYNYGILW